MNGITAQLVALVCQGNARLKGLEVAPLFPDNSTFKFCEYVRFQFPTATALGPDEWILETCKSSTGYRLGYSSSGNVDNDMALAGFAESNRWYIYVVGQDGLWRKWTAKWNTGGPDERPWRVDYQASETLSAVLTENISLNQARQRLYEALVDIHHFSQTVIEDQEFTAIFTKAMKTLSQKTDNQPVYYADMEPKNLLSLEARCLLNASSNANVFGGMGSWNDVGFDEKYTSEYNRVSRKLYEAMNTGLQVSVNSGCP